MTRKWRVPVAAGFGFTLVQVLGRAIGFLTVPLFTRLLPPEEYGLYALYVSAFGVVRLLAGWNMAGTGFYKALREGPSLRTVGVSATVASLLPFSLCALGYALLLAVGTVPFSLPPWLFAVLLVHAFADGVLSFTAATYRFSYRAGRYAWQSLTLSVASALFVIFLLRFTSLGGLSRIVAPAALTAAWAIAAGVTVFRRGKADKGVVLGLWRFYLPLLPYAFAVALLAENGRLILGTAVGTEALAAYSVASSLGLSVLLAAGGVQSVLQPWMLRKSETGQYERIREVLTPIGAGLAALCVALCLCAPELCRLLAPASYVGVSACVIPLTLSVLPHFTFQTFSAALCFAEKKGALTLVTSLGAGVSVAAGLRFIPPGGAAAAARITAASYGFLCLLLGLLFLREKEKIPIHAKKYLQIYGISWLECHFCGHLETYVILRYALLLLTVGFLLGLYGSTRQALCEPAGITES